jgi:hypothetical protein
MGQAYFSLQPNCVKRACQEAGEASAGHHCLGQSPSQLIAVDEEDLRAKIQ